jgi:hypothetical protein
MAYRGDGSGSDPLGPLRACLAPGIAAADFVLSDDLRDDELLWLEYRRASSDGVELLTIYLWPAERRIVAELWRPDHVLATLRAGRAEPDADHRVDRRYGDGDDLPATLEQIAEGITAWVGGAATLAG